MYPCLTWISIQIYSFPLLSNNPNPVSLACIIGEHFWDHFMSKQTMATYTTTRGRSDLRYPSQDFTVRRPPVIVVDRPRSPDYDRYGPATSNELVVDRRSVSRGSLRPNDSYRASSRSISRSSDYDVERVSVSRSRSRNRCRPEVEEVSKTVIIKKDEPRYISPPRRHRHRDDIQEIDITIIRVGNNTWIRVNVRDICPETVDHFGYRWEWDDVSLVLSSR